MADGLQKVKGWARLTPLSITMAYLMGDSYWDPKEPEEHLKRQGLGELYRYAQVYSRYKPLIDRAKKEYEASEELQILVKAAVPAYKAFKESEALMQLLATLPNILKELKAAHD